MANKSVKYTRICFLCKQEKSAYLWFKCNGGNDYLCKQCVNPYIVKSDSTILKLIEKLKSSS